MSILTFLTTKTLEIISYSLAHNSWIILYTYRAYSCKSNLLHLHCSTHTEDTFWSTVLTSEVTHMYTCTCTCTYKYIHTNIFTYLHTHTQGVYAQAYICTYMTAYTYAHTCKRTYWRTCMHKYTGCPRRNVPNFGRVFLRLKYTDITQNTYIQSWAVTEIIARENCGLLAVPRTVRIQSTARTLSSVM